MIVIITSIQRWNIAMVTLRLGLDMYELLLLPVDGG